MLYGDHQAKTFIQSGFRAEPTNLRGLVKRRIGIFIYRGDFFDIEVRGAMALRGPHRSRCDLTH